MKWSLLGMSFLFACGSVSSSPDASVRGDTGSAADAAMPDAPSPPRCNLASPFQAPIELTALNTTGANETNATLSADELTLYFCSNRPGGPGNGDIWFSTRASRTAVWGPPQVLPTVNTAAANECVTSVTADGLTMFLHVPVTNESLNIEISTRASKSDLWGPYSPPAAPFNQPGNVADGHVHISPDGNTAYFSSSRAGVNEDLWYVKKTNGVWGNAMPVPGIPTANLEVNPVFTPDELTMYWESYNNGGEIMLSTRASTTANFSAGTPQAVFNTNTNDEGPDYLTADGCELYFTRVTPTQADLYVSRRGN